MKSAIGTIGTFAVIVMMALGLTHLALTYAFAWVPAIQFYIVMLVCVACTMRQELTNIELPKIAGLDLRPEKSAEIIQLSDFQRPVRVGKRIRKHASTGTGTLELFP